MINMRLHISLFLCFLVLMFLWIPPASANNKTIIDEWTSVSIPTAPSLKLISVDVSSTAFLILDIQTRTFEQRPRCAASVPGIAEFLKNAREKDMTIVYSLTSTATPADIVSHISPLPSELVVKSSVDKFYNTDLDFILKQRGVRSVIIVGTAAHGAVLHTATAAAIRGYSVILPVDGMSAEDAYAEQYTAWHMINSPGTRNKVSLTKLSMIELY